MIPTKGSRTCIEPLAEAGDRESPGATEADLCLVLVASTDANLRCPGGAYTLEKEEKEGKKEKRKKEPFPCPCLATSKKAQPEICVGYEGVGLNTSILHFRTAS